MRFNDYGRNPELRKDHVQTPALLMVGLDIGQAKPYDLLRYLKLSHSGSKSITASVR